VGTPLLFRFAVYLAGASATLATGGAVNGDLLVAVSDWLGRSQGKYR